MTFIFLPQGSKFEPKLIFKKITEWSFCFPESLSFPNNGITDDSMECLAKLLTGPNRIRKLDLTNNLVKAIKDIANNLVWAMKYLANNLANDHKRNKVRH